jgi:hypothetical protein
MPLTVGSLATRLSQWIERLMPETPRRSVLTGVLAEQFAGRDDPVSADTCAEIEAVAQRYSRHLILEYEPDGTAEPDEHANGWPPEDPGAIRRRAGGVPEVRRIDERTSLLRLDSLESLPVAQPFLEAAIALSAGARRIVLDLRANGGGDPATVAFVASWVLGGGEATHLSTVVGRTGRRQWWTQPRPDGGGVPAAVPVAVLTSAATFSSGEALAYHLQARGRVRVIGESTRGGGDHVTPVRLAPTVLGLLPEAYVVDSVTGGNWEGSGVVPDVRCPADRALSVAVDATGPADVPS